MRNLLPKFFNIFRRQKTITIFSSSETFPQSFSSDTNSSFYESSYSDSASIFPISSDNSSSDKENEVTSTDSFATASSLYEGDSSDSSSSDEEHETHSRTQELYSSASIVCKNYGSSSLPSNDEQIKSKNISIYSHRHENHSDFYSTLLLSGKAVLIMSPDQQDSYLSESTESNPCKSEKPNCDEQHGASHNNALKCKYNS